ncbi:hypothetical protein NEOLEDRAFT_1143924 [Neolentinus lepideus HHB14362 ss-1]|uniref:DUF6534 domain-containing protein n=1 Tax=Neolentinus lepideus HHB14362 ss-1 TaxID=1314782 RepID=A0A165M7Z1_9AGAM|nr:hypothetical protein NEOLEDRAFT_1143924 [Neolentinus lepideus HHB14362 ss-1]
MTTFATVNAHQFGAAFLGVMVGVFLSGITAIQTLLYFGKCGKDKIYYKISVGVLCFLDALHLSFSIHMIYHYLINMAGKPNSKATTVWSLKAMAVFNVIIIWMVQCLYSVRIWQVSNMTVNIQSSKYTARIIAAAVAVVAIAAFGVGCAFIIEVTQPSDLTFYHQWWMFAANTTSAFVDTVLSGMMLMVCHWSQYSDTSGRILKRSSTLLRAILQYCIGSGLLTSVVAIATLILYSVKPDNLAYLAFIFAIPKLYVNSFIATLNLRRHFLRSLERTPATITVDLPNTYGSRFPKPYRKGSLEGFEPNTSDMVDNPAVPSAPVCSLADHCLVHGLVEEASLSTESASP